MPRRPATFTQSELTRAVKAAAVVGYAVEIRAGVIALVPGSKTAKNSSVAGSSDGGEEPNPWDAALA